MKTHFKIFAAACTILLSACAPSAEKSTATATRRQKPNIVFILADDLGYADLGCYGATKIQTPNIDRLASQGMKFTDAYAAPVCAPSRCTLLTGLSTGHCFIRGNTKVNLRPQDTTVTELLHNAGYYNFSIGKWSMGAVNSTGDPTHKDVDYFYGYIDQTHAHNSYPSYLYRNETKVPLRNVVPNEGRYGQGIATVKLDFSNDLFDQELARFLDQQAVSSQPFFIYAAFTAPHANDEAHENEVPSLGIYATKNWPLPEKQYAALVTRLDTSVGSILQKLHDHHLDNNTIVLFASDNGVQEEGNTHLEFFNSSGPLRGIKRDMYEGGIRVPFIARWPHHIPADTTSRLPIVFYDFLATACDLAHAPIPANTDGLSFLPTLLGEPQSEKHEFLYWEFHERGFEQAVRYEDWAHHTTWKAVRHSPTGPLELYNLTTDIGESRNVAADHPDVVAAITAYLATARTDSKEFPINTGKALPRRAAPLQ
jgi:arylsulfatase A-like enzyme